jgi:hypothetical protein
MSTRLELDQNESNLDKNHHVHDMKEKKDKVRVDYMFKAVITLELLRKSISMYHIEIYSIKF